MHRRSHNRTGAVLLTVLVTMLTVCLVVGLVSRFAVRSMRLASRTLDVERAFVCAEGGLGYGVMRTKQLLVEGGVAGFNSHYDEIETPSSPDSQYELRLLVRPISSSSSAGSTTIVAEQGSIEVVCGARNLSTGVSCTLRATISANGETLSDYAVFYEGDLEANVGDQNSGLTFRGKIHTNGDLYVSRYVTFDRNVTCNGNFYHRRKSNMSRDDEIGKKVFFRYGNDKSLTSSEKDSQPLVNTWDGTRYVDEEIGSEWISQSSLYYGEGIQTGQNGVTRLSPPINVDDDQYSLVEPPLDPSDPDYHPETESQKFANRAALTLHVNSDGSYTLKDNVHQIDITESLQQAELYSPGYWKGRYSEGEAYRTIPGYWWGSFNDKPTSGTWEWVPEYTPPLNENDTWWLNNFRSTGDYGGTEWYSNLAGYTWTASAVDDWNTGAGDAYGPARRVYYAKNPKTGAYIMKKKGGIQTVRADPTDSAEIRKVGNPFFDRRQGFVMAPTDIYLDEFLKIPAVKNALEAAPGGDVGIDKILYVEIDQPELMKGEKFTVTTVDGVKTATRQSTPNVGGSSYPCPCLRIRNASDPGTDLSIVTDQPVYVEGDFNTKVIGTNSDGSDQYRSTLIAGDRVTQLSKNWQDGNAMACVGASGGHGVSLVDNYGTTMGYGNAALTGSYAKRSPAVGKWNLAVGDSRRAAVTTTLNSVVMTGIFPTIVGKTTDNVEKGYSGGLENIFRFLENWGGKEFLFNGSIICLWNTQKTDRIWETPGGTAQNGAYGGGNIYYKAPKRIWAYTHMTPPGLPGFFAVREATWERTAWSRFWDD